MSELAVSSPTPRKLVPHVAGPLDQRKRKRGLTKAIRTAVDAMIFDRCARAEACERAAITERALYLALEKPEVAAYWNAQLQVLRTGERAKNIHRLTDIRDAADNMPAVNAIKVLEQLGDEQQQRGSGVSASPGVTIRVINVVQSGSVPTSRDSMSATDANVINDLAESDRS